ASTVLVPIQITIMADASTRRAERTMTLPPVIGFEPSCVPGTAIRTQLCQTIPPAAPRHSGSRSTVTHGRATTTKTVWARDETVRFADGSALQRSPKQIVGSPDATALHSLEIIRRIAANRPAVRRLD